MMKHPGLFLSQIRSFSANFHTQVFHHTKVIGKLYGPEEPTLPIQLHVSQKKPLTVALIFILTS